MEARDIKLVLLGRAPLQKLLDYKIRMRWSLDLVSSASSSFNYDFKVSFTKDSLNDGANNYNFTSQHFPMEDAPGISFFYKENNAIYHSYSTLSRGLDLINAAYHAMDLSPKGRREEGLASTMAWLRRKDEY